MLRRDDPWRQLADRDRQRDRRANTAIRASLGSGLLLALVSIVAHIL